MRMRFTSRMGTADGKRPTWSWPSTGRSAICTGLPTASAMTHINATTACTAALLMNMRAMEL